MALPTILLTANEQTNAVVLADTGLLKVASLASGILGSVSLSLQVVGSVGWSLPDAPSGLSIANNMDGSATIHFQNVAIQENPYLMRVLANLPDQSVVSIPLAVLVREPLSLEDVQTPGMASVTVTGKSYDSTLRSVVVHGRGPGGVESSVNFLPPTNLPGGLTAEVGSDGLLTLRVSQPTTQDLSGGIKASASLISVLVRGFKAGTLYDSPENAASLSVNFDLSSGAKTAYLNFEVGGSYDTTQRGILLDAIVGFRDGVTPAYTMEWVADVVGAGAWSATPGPTDKSAIWVPSGNAVTTVTFTVRVKDAGGNTLGTSTVGPFKVSGADPLDQYTNWTSTTAIPVRLYPAKIYPQDAGKTVYFKVALPDLSGNAVVTTTLSRVEGNSHVIDAPAPVGIDSNVSREAIIQFQVPANADIQDMWTVGIHVAADTRTGFAQLLVISNGEPTLIINPVVSAISGNTGSLIQPLTVEAYSWVQKALPTTPTEAYLNPVPTPTNSTLTKITGTSFSLIGAPSGLTPVVDLGTGITQVAGLVRSSGSQTFTVTGSKSGYGKGISSVITLSANEVVTPIRFTSFATSTPEVSRGGDVLLQWGNTGTGSTYVLREGVGGVQDASSLNHITQTNIQDATTFVLRGTNPLGEAFSAPLIVKLGSAGSVVQVQPSNTTATIDGNNRCAISWVPDPINGSYAAYHYWNVLFKDSVNGTPYVKKINTLGTETVLSGGHGTTESRLCEFDVTAGYHEMSMTAFPADSSGAPATWDSYKPFPATYPVTLDKTKVMTGEALTLTLGDPIPGSGAVADRWMAVFGDGVFTDWFPMSIKSVAKAFSAGGMTQSVRVVVETSNPTAFPAVSLRRLVQMSVYVDKNKYQGSNSGLDITQVSTGVGTEAGFEVTANVDGGMELPPYLAIMSAVVRDDVTNEMKLMIATARGSDGSSQLGTMALDVYPLPGRPHTLDLIKTGKALMSNGVTYVPVSITQEALPDVILGKAINSVQLQATGGLGPYQWFTESLPYGLDLSGDGRLSGTVLELGSYTINVSVMDSQNPASQAEKTLTLVGKSDLSINDSVTPAASVGEFYSSQMSGSLGVAPYSWKLVSGSLPVGLSITPDGLITGWPVTTDADNDFTSERFAFVAQVTDSVGASVSKQMTMTLTQQPLAVGDADQGVLVLGQQFKLRFPVYGGTAPYTMDGIPSAPAGFVRAVSLINGVVEILTNENYVPENPGDTSVNVAVSVRDASNTPATTHASFVLTPATAIAQWVKASFDSWVGPLSNPESIHLSGLFGGLNYNPVAMDLAQSGMGVSQDQATATVSLSGPVTAGKNTESTLRVTIRRGAFSMATITREYSAQSFDTSSPSSLVRTWTARPLPLMVGRAFAFDITSPAINPPETMAIAPGKLRVKSGSVLPDGVCVNSTTGMLYGIPRSSSGTDSTQFEIIDTNNEVTATVTVIWVISGEALQISGAIPTLEVGQLLDTTLTVVGASAVTASVAHGRIPEGITLSTSGSSIHLTGRPTETGYFDIYLQVADASDPTKSGLFNTRLVVSYRQLLTIITESLPKIIKAVPYHNHIHAQGGAAPYTFAIAPGSNPLPAGITISPEGVVSGTGSLDASSALVDFQVTDSFGQKSVSRLQVVEGLPDALVVTTSSLPSGVVGVPYDGIQVATTGGATPLSFVSAYLPSGLHLDGATGVLSGTPTSPFSSVVTVSVTDALGTVMTKTLGMVIQAEGSFMITTDSLPVGRVAVPFGGAGVGTPATRTLASAPSPRVGHTTDLLLVGDRNYLVTLGGVGYANPSPSWSPSASVDTDPLLFDYDVAVGGQRLGQWSNSVIFQWVRTNQTAVDTLDYQTADRVFSASAKVGESELVLVGGAYVFGGTLTNYGPSIQGGDSGNTNTEEDGPSSIVFVKFSSSNRGPVAQLTPGPKLPGSNSGRHGMAATTLNDGKVFVCGGRSLVLVNDLVDPDLRTIQDNASVHSDEAYVLTLNANRRNSTWVQVTSMPKALVFPKAVTLPDGRVLVVGGLERSGSWYSDTEGVTDTHIYNHLSDAWTAGPALPVKMFNHAMTLLPDGRVLVSSSGSSTYILDIEVTAWSVFSNGVGSVWGTIVALPSGDVVGFGGTNRASLLAQEDTQGLLAPYASGFIPKTYLSGIYPYPGGSAFNPAFSPLFVSPTGNSGTACFYLTTTTVLATSLHATGGNLPYGGWGMSPAVAGLTLDAASGALHGTPTTGYHGLVTFTATDSTTVGAGGPLVAPSKSIWLDIVDPDAPLWTPSSIPSGSLGEAYSFLLTATDTDGNPLVGVFAVSPNSAFQLPGGVTLSASGLLSGTPTVPYARDIILRVSNPSAPTKYLDRTFTLIFACNTNVSNLSPLPTVVPGVAYTTTLSSSGGTAPYSWSVASGVLPAGLTLAPSSGVISGIPQAAADQSVTCSFSVTDANGCIGSKDLMFQIRGSDFSITPGTLSGTKFLAFSTQLSASGGSAPYTWSINGLPGEFNYNPATGQIVATSVISNPQDYPLVARATDSTGAFSTHNLTLTIQEPGFSFGSGPQADLGAWGGQTNPVPLGMIWQRFPSRVPDYGTPGRAFVVGVAAAGTFKTQAPVITLQPAGGTGWTAVCMVPGWHTATYYITPTGDVTDFSGPFTISGVLNDGGVSSPVAFRVYVKPLSANDLPAGAHFSDGSGVSPSSNYSE